MVSTKTLVKIAIGGGWFTLGSAAFFKYKIAKDWRSNVFHQKSMTILGGYSPAGEILGKPITLPSLDHGDRRLNHSDGQVARLAIPLRGKKENGVLHSWTSLRDEDNEWQVDKCDIEVNGKQWTFYINPNSTDRYSITIPGSSNEDLKLVKKFSDKEENRIDETNKLSKSDPKSDKENIPSELEYITKQ